MAPNSVVLPSSHNIITKLIFIGTYMYIYEEKKVRLKLRPKRVHAYIRCNIMAMGRPSFPSLFLREHRNLFGWESSNYLKIYRWLYYVNEEYKYVYKYFLFFLGIVAWHLLHDSEMPSWSFLARYSGNFEGTYWWLINK